MKSVAVVGAGFAGLSAALELARAGVRVAVFERQDRPGGRARELLSPDGRFRFDMGPTLLVLPNRLRRTLGDEAFADLALQRLEPGYTVLWPDSERFEMHSDVALWLREIERFEGKRGRPAALAYLARVYEHFTGSRSFLLDGDGSPRALLAALPQFRASGFWAVRRLIRFTERYFSHPRVVEALTFQTLYLGLAPDVAPAAYALLPVIEIVEGVWKPARGGTGELVEAMMGACRAEGVELSFGCTVDAVRERGGRATALIVNGREKNFDAVVVTMDREPALQQLFGARPPRQRVRYGLSALVAFLGVRGRTRLGYHTVLLPRDPAAAYAELRRGRVPNEPPVYVCARPSQNTSDASTDGEDTALMMLLPVPNLHAAPSIDEEAHVEKALDALERVVPDVRERIVFRHIVGPRALRDDLGLMHGAAFGPDHTLQQMGPLRPSIRHGSLKNVAFAGSGTHPGSGVPLVLASGALAARRVLETL